MSHSKFDPNSPSERSNESPLDEAAEAELYYERLEQAGKLVDVDEATDLAGLPPHVTHIRHPDGTIERLGYS